MPLNILEYQVTPFDGVEIEVLIPDVYSVSECSAIVQSIQSWKFSK
jgi:hypothetical protein